MQFFIIHNDPKTNFNTLPHYAIHKVNIREGYQILSDIGHLFNVNWIGQNKPYSIYHAETRRFWRNKESFINFLRHYKYHVDRATTANWKLKYKYFLICKGPNKIIKAIEDNNIKDEFSQMLFKLITQKKHLITSEELDILKEKLRGEK